MNRRRDAGEGAPGYIGVILLVAAIVAAVVVVAVPQRVGAGIQAAVCRVTGQDCDPTAPGGPAAPPATPAPSGPAVGDEDPWALPPPDVPALTEYGDAKNDADQADADLRAAEGELSGIKDELIGLLKDLIGLEALEKCLGEGDIVACLEVAATAVPWGKFFKLLKTLPKAIKLANKLKRIWDKVSTARKRRDDAQDRLRRALDDLNKSCPVKPAAFRPGAPPGTGPPGAVVAPARWTGDRPVVAVPARGPEPPGKWDCIVAGMTPEQLAAARQTRLKYHGLIKDMRKTEGDMRAAGATDEQIARKLVEMRNQAKDITRAGMKPEEVAALKARNLEKYGDPLGPSADQLFEKYGSWDQVIEASKRTNPELDRALGLDPP